MSDINRQKIMIYYGGFRDILGGVNSHISNLEKEYKNEYLNLINKLNC